MAKPSQDEIQDTRDAYRLKGRSIVEALALKHINREVAIELAVSLGFEPWAIKVWSEQLKEERNTVKQKSPGQRIHEANQLIEKVMRNI